MPDLTALALDLGGSHAACEIVRGDIILAKRSLPADGASCFASILLALSETLSELLRTAQINIAECSALVLGFPAIVSPREERVLATNSKFDDAPNLDLEAWSRHVFGLPLLLENDARLVLQGEYRFGAARDDRGAVLVTLETGIGGAAMLDGRLLERFWPLGCTDPLRAAEPATKAGLLGAISLMEYSQ